MAEHTTGTDCTCAATLIQTSAHEDECAVNQAQWDDPEYVALPCPWCRDCGCAESEHTATPAPDTAAVEALARVEELRDRARSLVQQHFHGPNPNPSRAGAWAAVVRELDAALAPTRTEGGA